MVLTKIVYLISFDFFYLTLLNSVTRRDATGIQVYWEIPGIPGIIPGFLFGIPVSKYRKIIFSAKLQFWMV